MRQESEGDETKWQNDDAMRKIVDAEYPKLQSKYNELALSNIHMAKAESFRVMEVVFWDCIVL